MKRLFLEVLISAIAITASGMYSIERAKVKVDKQVIDEAAQVIESLYKEEQDAIAVADTCENECAEWAHEFIKRHDEMMKASYSK